MATEGPTQVEQQLVVAGAGDEPDADGQAVEAHEWERHLRQPGDR
jgi:hypothetical protein